MFRKDTKYKTKSTAKLTDKLNGHGGPRLSQEQPTTDCLLQLSCFWTSPGHATPQCAAQPLVQGLDLPPPVIALSITAGLGPCPCHMCSWNAAVMRLKCYSGSYFDPDPSLSQLCLWQTLFSSLAFW